MQHPRPADQDVSSGSLFEDGLGRRARAERLIVRLLHTPRQGHRVQFCSIALPPRRACRKLPAVVAMAGPYLVATGQPPCFDGTDALYLGILIRCPTSGTYHQNPHRITHPKVYLLCPSPRHRSKTALLPVTIHLGDRLSQQHIAIITQWPPQTYRSRRSLHLLCPTTSPLPTLCSATKECNGATAERPTTPRPARSGKKVSSSSNVWSSWIAGWQAHGHRCCATYHARRHVAF